MTLRRKLIMSIAAGVALTFLLGGILFYFHAIDKIDTEMQAALEVGAGIAANAVDAHEDAANMASSLELMVKDFDGDRHLQAMVVGADDKIHHKSELAAPDKEIPGWFYRLFSGQSRRTIVPLPDKFSAIGRIELEANPKNEIGEAWEDMVNTLRILSILTIFISCAVYWILGSALKPLEQLAAAFSQFGHVADPVLVSESGPDEFRRVYRAFNTMVSRQKHAEATNRKLNEQLLNVQDEERADIARDLHDDIGPFLFNVDVEATTILKLSEEKNYAALPQHVQHIREAVSHMQKHVRGILSRLRPAALLDLGLQDALEHLVESWQSRQPGIAITLSFDLPQLASRQQDTVFRVVQEAINNAVRHGKPTKIQIMTQVKSDRIELEITDNGSGFVDLDARGFGILGMRERVAHHDGTLQVSNNDRGPGACVRAEFPLSTTHV